MTEGSRISPPRRPPVPDALLARMALSEMRSIVRLGFGLVRDGIDHMPLPAPVAALTGSVLRKVDDFAHQADAVAKTAVDSLLGPASRDAGRLVVTLERVVQAMDAPGFRVSGTATHEALTGREPIHGAEDAGRVMRDLVVAGAVRPAGPAASAALFAAVLAHLQPGDDAATLAACLSIASALSDEIAAADGDAPALARLFAEFRDHV